MFVRVKFFATLRDAAGTEECGLALEPGSRGQDARTILVKRYPRLAGLIDSARLAVNRDYQSWEISVHEGDELALIPPVSGG